MLTGIRLLVLSFFLQSVTCSLSPELQSFADNLFKSISPESTKTLSASKLADDFYLTKGSTNQQAVEMHQHATAMLSAVRSLKNSTLSKADQDTVMLSAYLPKDYCPHDIDSYDCDPSYPYRSIDGSCNNLYTAWWGKANTIYDRILDNAYDDGYDSPRIKSIVRGYWLPNARTVAKKIHRARRVVAETTHFFVFFAQFIDHDVTSISRVRESCPCGTYKTECFNINIPLYDYYNKDQECFPFTRSSAAIDEYECKLSHREQLNTVTGYTDLSNIYGSDDETANNLRTKVDGLLKTSENPVTGMEDLARLEGCPMQKNFGSKQCFLTADRRDEQNHYLLMLNRIWFLEHNRIAKELKYLNKHWDDERLYQEARKINIAQYQHMVYYEYLPMLLGSEAMEKFKLLPYDYTGYNKYVNPQTKNEFASAIGRFGHTLINKNHLEYDSELYLVLNSTTDYIIKNHQDYPNDVLRGALLQNSYYQTPAINNVLNNYLFEGLSENFMRLSLGALNIQRGRDHGLPGYCFYRKWCGLDSQYPESFDAFVEIPKSIRDELAKLYKSPCDVDLFTGAMSEYAVHDGVVGPTSACIMADNFYSWKFGDRFFYKAQGQFSQNQLRQIKKVTMAHIICDNSDMTFVQANPFIEASGDYNDLIDCSYLDKVDLSEWKEDD